MNKNNTLLSHIQELNHMVYEIGAEISYMHHIAEMLNGIATKANDAKETEHEKCFLFDNNGALQISDDYFQRVLNVVDKKQKKIEDIAAFLFDNMVKENTLEPGKEQG